MIVWLASYPRSGNTFLRLALRRLYGLPTLSVYDESSSSPDADAIAELTGGRADSRTLDELAADAAPHFVKTHELPHDECPAMYVVRDGRDALVSYARFQLTYVRPGTDANDASAFDEVLRDVVTEDTSFGGWSANVLAWTRRAAPTAVIPFEQLVAEPETRVVSALASLGLPLVPLEAGAVPGFAELQRRIPGFFRAGRSGAWREVMSDDLHERFWLRHGDAMRALGYER
jgi:hypothetical protein